jgi:hypothetical protein
MGATLLRQKADKTRPKKQIGLEKTLVDCARTHSSECFSKLKLWVDQN